MSPRVAQSRPESPRVAFKVGELDLRKNFEKKRAFALRPGLLFCTIHFMPRGFHKKLTNKFVADDVLSFEDAEIKLDNAVRMAQEYVSEAREVVTEKSATLNDFSPRSQQFNRKMKRRMKQHQKSERSELDLEIDWLFHMMGVAETAEGRELWKQRWLEAVARRAQQRKES